MGSNLKIRVTLAFRERRIELTPGRYVLGRSSGSTIRVNEAQVSREHLELTVTDSSLSVTDLGSKNGTKVNGNLIDRKTALGHDDCIKLGTVELSISLIPDSEFFVEEDTVTLTGRVGFSLVENDSMPACPQCEAVLPDCDPAHCPYCGHKLGRATSYTAELPVLDPDSSR